MIRMFWLICVLFLGLLVAATDFNKASKSELMNIKGIGVKKAEAIIEYRKSNKISSADDLENIKGFGKKLISKIKMYESMSK